MKAGVKLVERDDRLSCYPALLRVSPGEKAVYINRKRERRIRPSVFVNLLQEQQARPLSFRPGRLPGCSVPGLFQNSC